MDLSRQHADIEADLVTAFEETTRRGDFILGDAVERFEREFGEYVGAAETVGIASGTAALTIGLGALGIGPGDEVIVPAHTFVASALSVIHAGAQPVLCDVQPETGLIDLGSAAELVGPRTAAVIVVHLYGQACDMEAAQGFCRAHGVALVEDAAQAHGAEWAGRRAGSFAEVAAFSFYPSKNLGALGDAGALCARDGAVADRARELRNLGQRTKGEHSSAGFNERLDTLQAAFLRLKLPHLDAWNRDRRRAARAYGELLPAAVGRLPERPGAIDVHHLFPVRLTERDAVADRLRHDGIATGLHYTPPLHRQPPLREARRTEVPNAEGWAREELSLPIFPGISEDEVARVCESLAEAVAA